VALSFTSLAASLDVESAIQAGGLFLAFMTRLTFSNFEVKVS
jgi:hypothetical protein